MCNIYFLTIIYTICSIILFCLHENISAFKNRPYDYIGECEASDNAISRHLREARERVCPHLPFAGEHGDVPYTGLGRSAEAHRNPGSGTPVSLISTSRPRVGGGGGHRVPFCPSGFTGSILPVSPWQKSRPSPPPFHVHRRRHRHHRASLGSSLASHPSWPQILPLGVSLLSFLILRKETRVARTIMNS